MVDKKLLERIADATCEKAELADFCANIDEREYDLDGSFGKYYRLGRILHTIERFERGEIDVDYLMMWATAYDWIIMATERAKNDFSDRLIGFEDYLIEEISRTLDSLSFLDIFAETEEEYAEQLGDYKDVFLEYDYVLSTLGEWTASCTVIEPPEDLADECDPDIRFLAVNESKKLFEQFAVFGYVFDVAKIKEPKITPEEMTERIAALKDAGYREPTV